jgi:hypothetical protein
MRSRRFSHCRSMSYLMKNRWRLEFLWRLIFREHRLGTKIIILWSVLKSYWDLLKNLHSPK